MTKVLAQRLCCLRALSGLQLFYGKENLLDDLHRARPASGFSPAALVGPGGDLSHPLCLMVGRLPQRLVLRRGLGHLETAGRVDVTSRDCRAAGIRPRTRCHRVGKRVRVPLDAILRSKHRSR